MKRSASIVLRMCVLYMAMWFSLPVFAAGTGDAPVAAATEVPVPVATEEPNAAVTEEMQAAAAEEASTAVTEEMPAAAAEEANAAVAERVAATTEAPAAAVTEEAVTATEGSAAVKMEAPAAVVTEELAATTENKIVPSTEKKPAVTTEKKTAVATTEKPADLSGKAKEKPVKVKAGWFKKGGSYYYRKSDGSVIRSSGMIKIGKYRYCLGKKGKRLGGLQKVKGKWYYFNPKTGRREEKAGWKKIKGKKYYIQKKGVIATGVKKIGKLQYGFMATGELRGASNPFEYKGKWYRTDRYGVAEKLSSTQLACSRETRKFIEKHTTSDMSSQEKLRCLYHILLSGNYVSGCIDRSETEVEDFQYRIAYKVLINHGRYNCYGFACTVASVAKELGFESYVVVLDCDHAVMMIDGKYYDNMGARFGADSPALKDEKEYKKVKF